jgi:flavin reductase (DIM6/NTAB) family NADH-FMN oxidoreductase RutF
MDLAVQMNATAAHVAPEIDEFTIAGQTAAPSRVVNVMRVAKSPAFIRECKVTELIQLKSADGREAEAWLTFGEGVAVHIEKPSSGMASTTLRSHAPSHELAGAAIISR